MPTNSIEELTRLLPCQTGFLITAPVSRRFLTGFDSSDGMLFLSQKECVFLTDSRYIEAAKERIAICPVEEFRDPRKQLRALCKRNKIRRLQLELSKTNLMEASNYQNWLWDSTRVVTGRHRFWGALTSERLLEINLKRLRRAKTPEQADCVRRAQRIAEAALTAVLQNDFREGVTERELALALDFHMLRNGAEALSFETIVVAGENGSRPHGVPGGRPLRGGDFVTMDFGAVVDGWHSDMTRTTALDGIDEEQRKIYGTVLAAQRAALDRIRPGVACKEVDAAARRVIEEAGYGEYFRHGAGHGVGLEIHEAPTLSSKSEDILAPGDIVTVEPGIYLPGKCGVRIEDMALVTEDGYENLTQAAK